MSKNESNGVKKIVVTAIVMIVLSTLGNMAFNARWVKADTDRNTKAVSDWQEERKEFVIKVDNDADHLQIYSLIRSNENTVIERMDANQRFLLERIENVNDNVIKLHNNE